MTNRGEIIDVRVRRRECQTQVGRDLPEVEVRLGFYKVEFKVSKSFATAASGVVWILTALVCGLTAEWRQQQRVQNVIHRPSSVLGNTGKLSMNDWYLTSNEVENWSFRDFLCMGNPRPFRQPIVLWNCETLRQILSYTLCSWKLEIYNIIIFDYRCLRPRLPVLFHFSNCYVKKLLRLQETRLTFTARTWCLLLNDVQYSINGLMSRPLDLPCSCAVLMVSWEDDPELSVFLTAWERGNRGIGCGVKCLLGNFKT